MKTTLAAITTTFALAAAPFATAQDGTSRVRRAPAPPSRTQPKVIHQSTSNPAKEFLANNVSVTLAGVVGDDIPLDITLTGCAANVNSDLILEGGEVPTIASISYFIREASGKYTVTYQLGVRLPVVTSTSGTNKSISFHEASLANTVHCHPGKPVQIYKSGKNALTLTIAEAPRD